MDAISLAGAGMSAGQALLDAAAGAVARAGLPTAPVVAATAGPQSGTSTPSAAAPAIDLAAQLCTLVIAQRAIELNAATISRAVAAYQSILTAASTTDG